MNRIDFNQAGGFPLETNTLEEVQNAYSIFNALGHLAGEKSIIKGCEITGNTVNDGVVFLNGELITFRGGYIQSNVIIKEDITTKPFENGETKQVLYNRYLTFGSGIGAIPWSDFKQVNPIQKIQKAIVPPGLISLWSGSITTIPKGWLLCDGANGTPNLSGRFIVGYDPNDPDYNQINKTGGLKAVNLTQEQMPVHNHTAKTSNSGSHLHRGYTDNAGIHNHDYKDSYYIESTEPKQNQFPNYGSEYVGTGFSGSGDVDRDNKFMWYKNSLTNTGGNHSHSLNIGESGDHNHTVSIDNSGGNTPHENRPPYYTLAYIMFKG